MAKDDSFNVSYFVGEDSPVEYGGRSWEDLLSSDIPEWVVQVLADDEIPDLWSNPPNTKSFLTGKEYDELDNRSFTAQEQAQIEKHLQEIKEYIKATQSLSNEQLTRIESTLKETEQASHRIGNKILDPTVLRNSVQPDRYERTISAGGRTHPNDDPSRHWLPVRLRRSCAANNNLKVPAISEVGRPKRLAQHPYNRRTAQLHDVRQLCGPSGRGLGLCAGAALRAAELFLTSPPPQGDPEAEVRNGSAAQQLQLNRLGQNSRASGSAGTESSEVVRREPRRALPRRPRLVVGTGSALSPAVGGSSVGVLAKCLKL